MSVPYPSRNALAFSYPFFFFIFFLSKIAFQFRQADRKVRDFLGVEAIIIRACG
jgi:hypothetical protein